jgi:hypothetical protein
MSFAKEYIDVAGRLAEMREKFPDLTMQQVKLEFIEFGGKSWVVYTAAAYRNADDLLPGIGTAWEPVPGPTNFTRDSEVQNAETSAWGRALIAIGASTRQGIASADEVRNRSTKPEDRPAPEERPIWADLAGMLSDAFPTPEQRRAFVEETLGRPLDGGIRTLAAIDLEEVEAALQARTAPSDAVSEAQEFVDRMVTK